MNCHDTDRLLAARLDGELSAAESCALEAHLATCAACRRGARELAEQDSKLRRAFADRRAAAGDVADDVLTALAAERPVGATRWPRIMTAASLAAGFVIAVLVFRPWERPDADAPAVDPPRDETAAEAAMCARVESLLSRIGSEPGGCAAEDELRSIGGSCVEPLVEQVEKRCATAEATARRHAARLLADVAPSWSVGRLIPLLHDRDPEVRFHVARALRRLIGRDFGVDPEIWRRPGGPCCACDAAYEKCARWWAQNRDKWEATKIKAAP